MNQKQQAIQRLEKLLEQDLEQLKNNIILQDGNRFLVFDGYCIERNAGRYRIYKFTSDIGEFTSSRTALSWCIADKYGQINLAQEIKNLDYHKGLLAADLTVRESMVHKIKDKDISSKIEIRRSKLQTVSERLDKCVNLAKYWQIRGFNNETARTGRTASNRSSR